MLAIFGFNTFCAYQAGRTDEVLDDLALIYVLLNDFTNWFIALV